MVDFAVVVYGVEVGVTVDVAFGVTCCVVVAVCFGLDVDVVVDVVVLAEDDEEELPL